jgi:RNA polymerase sigma-70 factor (TIGR02943 family)
MNVQEWVKAAPTEKSDLQPRLWVKRYADYLYAFALARIHCNEKARDLVQDTFLAALEKADSFEKKSSEKTWLTGILKHKIFDLYRKQSKHALNREKTMDHFFRATDGHWHATQAPTDFVSGQSHVVEAKEYYQALQSCIKKLPEAWLAVFTMKHMEDYSTAAICHQLKITQSNFWVIIHRAKVNLRACLEKNS